MSFLKLTRRPHQGYIIRHRGDGSEIFIEILEVDRDTCRVMVGTTCAKELYDICREEIADKFLPEFKKEEPVRHTAVTQTVGVAKEPPFGV
jgi:sRNA-binding carbon storage regulator CsrA